MKIYREDFVEESAKTVTKGTFSAMETRRPSLVISGESRVPASASLASKLRRFTNTINALVWGWPASSNIL